MLSILLVCIVILCRFVSERMGGAVDKGSLANFSWELSISNLKLQRQSNVLPLGSVTAGIFYHRALLFKVFPAVMYIWFLVLWLKTVADYGILRGYSSLST